MENNTNIIDGQIIDEKAAEQQQNEQQTSAGQTTSVKQQATEQIKKIGWKKIVGVLVGGAVLCVGAKVVMKAMKAASTPVPAIGMNPSAAAQQIVSQIPETLNAVAPAAAEAVTQTATQAADAVSTMSVSDVVADTMTM